METDSEVPLAAVIMAAGQGKRMADPSLPKVLYPIGGEPMVGHVMRLCAKIGATPVICIVGYGRDAVSAYLQKEFPETKTAIQEEQLGTGHAVQQAERLLVGFHGDVLVLSGDVPLLTASTARKLIEEHRGKNCIATVLSVVLKNPKGYGRIIRTESGSLDRIVEEKDATNEEREIHEINSGIYVFDTKILFEVLKRIDRKNAQGEFYLTDTLSLIIQQFGLGAVAVVTTQDAIEVSGVNTKDQLAELDTEWQKRQSASSE